MQLSSATTSLRSRIADPRNSFRSCFQESIYRLLSSDLFKLTVRVMFAPNNKLIAKINVAVIGLHHPHWPLNV